jgi:hypothetical protein
VNKLKQKPSDKQHLGKLLFEGRDGTGMMMIGISSTILEFGFRSGMLKGSLAEGSKNK